MKTYGKITLITVSLIAIFYPFLIYSGLSRFQPRTVSVAVCLLILIRIALMKNSDLKLKLMLPLLLITAMALISFFTNHRLILLMIPLVINYGFFITFAYSLFHPPSMIEIFAGLQLKALKSANALSPDEKKYCTLITVMWSVFFFINGIIIILIIIYMPLEIWSIYTGLISYVLMGALFASELTYRYWKFRRYDGFPADFIYKKIFPPHGKIRA